MQWTWGRVRLYFPLSLPHGRTQTRDSNALESKAWEEAKKLLSLSPSLIRTLCGPRSDEEQDGFSRTRCLMGGKETSSSSASPPSLVWDCLLWPVCKTRFLVSFMGFWFSFPVGSFFFVGLALVRFRPGGCFQSISPLWSRSVFLGASCRSYWANCLQKRGILLLFIMLDRNLGVDSVQNNSFFFFHHADWLSI